MQRVVLASIAAAVSLVSATALSAPCAGFNDVEDTSAFCTSVAWMKNRAITLGCVGDGSLYCPDQFVRRDQMAAFMYRLGFQNAFLNGGNTFGATAVLGSRDNFALYLRVNDRTVMRYLPDAISASLLGGHSGNNVTTGVRGATIAGGGVQAGDSDPDFTDEAPNRVMDHYGTVGGGYANQAGSAIGGISFSPFATVAGGRSNTAGSSYSVVAGGVGNIAGGPYSTVAGGQSNEASGTASVVGGGDNNTASNWGSTVVGGEGSIASGRSSTVAGGYGNAAGGNYSLSAGINANAAHDRSFVWNGDMGNTTSSLAAGDFVVYAPSRVRLYAGTYGSGGCEIGTGNVGGNLTCQGVITASAFVPPSDRALKSDIVPVDPSAVLARVVAMPIAEWSYTSTPGVRHIGPMGQDFHAAFGLGATDKGIATVDADGVALAAIQGLHARLEAKDAEIAALKREMARLRTAVDMLMTRAPAGEHVAQIP